MQEEKQNNLHQILFDLARDKITATQIQSYQRRLRDVYQNNFRHSYSGIHGAVTRIDEDPKFNFDILQNNLQQICETNHSNRNDEIFQIKLDKLYDHVNLDIARINYVKELHLRQEKRDRMTRIELEKINERAQRMQRDYVTILGIFSAIIIAFVAGLNISSSALNNIDKVSVYQLTFVILLLAIFLSDLLYILLDFIQKIRGIRKPINWKEPIILINGLFIVLMFVDIIVWKFFSR